MKLLTTISHYFFATLAIIACIIGFLFILGVIYDGWTNHIPHVIISWIIAIISTIIAIRCDRCDK